MRLANPIIVLLLLLLSQISSGQSLVETIEKTEKAVFEITGYSDHGAPTGTASGFFISADGLAITIGAVLEQADSAVVVTRNGRDYKVDRVVATHPYSNLTLIKVRQTRQRSFAYLIPAKRSFREFEELLVFTHEDETESGTALARIGEINYLPFINRCGLVNADYGIRSHGAPVINQDGELAGVINGLSGQSRKVVYNAYLVSDTSWVTINSRMNVLPTYPERNHYLNGLLSQSVMHYLAGNYMESAKSLSRYIKRNPEDAAAYSFRGMARYRYNNNMGSRDDFKTAVRIDATCHYVFYFRAQVALMKKNENEARVNLDLCLSRQPSFSPAIVELTRLQFHQNRDARWALEQYTKAIDSDSLNAEAYYERARLLLQYFENQDLAFDDVNQAIYLNPNLAGVYSIRGTIKFANEDFLDAINDFNRAIEKDPNDVYAYFNRGVAHYNIGLKESACSDWQKAGELGNYKAFRYISRYCNQLRRGNYDNRQ